MSDAAVVPEAIDTPQRSLWSDVWFQFRHHKGAMAGVVIFTAIVLVVVFGPLVHTTDPQFIDVRARNAWPSLAHPMGTDNIGRDVFAQLMQGGRVSLAVGVIAMLIAVFVGTLVGVLAAKSIGAPSRRIIARHILPNVLSPIMVSATLGVANAIITESALSFLGLGFPPDFPTWGRLLFDGANFMMLTPARVIWPGLAISLTVLSINFIGDGLRDALDPRIRGR